MQVVGFSGIATAEVDVDGRPDLDDGADLEVWPQVDEIEDSLAWNRDRRSSDRELQLDHVCPAQEDISFGRAGITPSREVLDSRLP